MKNDFLAKENKEQYNKIREMEEKFRMAERQWDQLQGEGQRAHHMI
jgi:hypothetical protein